MVRMEKDIAIVLVVELFKKLKEDKEVRFQHKKNFMYQNIYTKTIDVLELQTKSEIEKMFIDSREHILNKLDEFVNDSA